MTSYTSETTPTNRRRFVRVPANCKVVAQRVLFFARGGSRAWGEVKNIGAGGLLFTTELNCQPLERLRVTMELSTVTAGTGVMTPDDRANAENQTVSITAICEVLRSRPLADNRFELAARFISVPNEDLANLKRFIEGETDRLARRRNSDLATSPVH